MIRRIQKILSAVRTQPRHRTINSALLEQQRDDVFILMHQQMGGLR